MKDNEQSRFIRWGIPGWMMFLAFISYSAIDILLSPDSKKNTLVGFLTGLAGEFSLDSTASAAVVLLVAAAGIPLGFFIYQIYFYIRWNSPFSRDGLFPPFIVGRWNDIDRTMMGIDESEIAGNDLWRIDSLSDPFYKIDHGLKWRYIENYFTEIVQKLDNDNNGASFYSRYRYLMDLMHILGAGLFGIYLGYSGYLLAKVKVESLSLTILLMNHAVLLFILFWLLEAEDKVKRERTNLDSVTNGGFLVVRLFKKISTIQFSNPSAIYLLFCFAFLYLGSPSPYATQYTTSHLIFRSVALIVTVCAWMIYKRNYPKQIFWTELITLILLGALAYGASQWVKNWMDFKSEWWNIGWAMLVFLVTNMVFVKNRQNTRDDLIAIQNYTIKRYLSLQKSKSERKPAKRRTTKAK